MNKTFNEWAKFWFYIIGVNVIPADSKKKIPLVKWTEYQSNPISEKQFKEWIDNNTFKDGLAIICGKVWRGEHKDKWLNGIDCDNKIGLDKMCSSGIKKVAEMTIVEQHANKNKCHIYFYTKESIKSKVANDGKNNTIPQIEVKSGGKYLLYCSGSLHKDNSLIDILGINKVKTIDKENLENRINDICKEYNIPYLNGIAETQKPISEIIKDDFEIHEGENRSLAIVRYLDSKKINNPEFDENVLFNLGMKFNQDHCKPNYPESKIRELAKQALDFGEKNIQKKENKTKKLEIPATIQAYNIGMELIKKSIKSENDTEQIVIKIKLHDKHHWIDVFSPTFNQMIRLGTQKKFGKIYGDSIYTTSIKNIHADSLLNNTITRPIFNRSALINGVLYYDFQDNDGTIYKISKDGISEVQNDDNIPIFLKSPSAKTFTSTQPKPLFDNDEAFDELVKLYRIKDDDKIIFKSHLICYFLTGFPIPIAIIHGEQGSAKTSTSSSMKSLSDPEGECALSLPEKVDDLAVVLSGHEISNFDNTDNFKKELSQFFCKAVTGTQYIKRQLYSNGEEFSLILKSKIILNGISPTIDQPDLLERSIFYELPSIDKKERMTDDKFLAKFNELKPHVLGYVFKTIQKAMIIYDEVNKELDGISLPRMASFAVWGEAISRSLGHEKNKFIERYDVKIEDSNLSLSDEYPIIELMINYMNEKENQVLLISKLFSSIVDLEKKDDRLPKDSMQFSKQLKQLAPTIRTLGYEVTTRKYNKRDNTFPRGSTIVSITRISEVGIEKYTKK